MANCKLIYPSGEVTQVTYNCVKNYDYGDIQGYIESDDNIRCLDGTLNSYIGPRKKTFSLRFSYVEKEQRDALLLAWNVGGSIDLYLDGSSVSPDAIVKIMEPPSITKEAAFDGTSRPTYSFDLVMEEV